ncbi:DNA repair protein RecO [Ahrensia sp. R2A130]|uniref:DNA repair protein RecO n=1 Tax=Ahrensia sp. R2A130 TaxID=744979 RepID=UPI0001E0A447|nr:DNA repair protein RecO [Ahrensia sp. R2A130]EFL90655.1 DNA repair protein RecO [Ahrensia sp. R2A130]
MEWTDQAIVLGVRKHGETSVVAELMTRQRGRHLGLVHGGRSRTMRPILQPGNRVTATWRARLDEHLGQFRIEADNLRAARLMETDYAIYALQTLASHLRLLAERDAHPQLYDTLDLVLDALDNPAAAGELVIRFELALLDELGFGLDLNACAATGARANLVSVSPRTGRAVSGAAAAPYGDRLLALPSFLTTAQADRTSGADEETLAQGFALTGHFLHRNVFGARGINPPAERDSLIRAVT